MFSLPFFMLMAVLAGGARSIEKRDWQALAALGFGIAVAVAFHGLLFAGVAPRLDAIWLSPFYPSPQKDSGYDVANPRDVDPRYGTLADAQALIDQAHARGLRVIVDIVPNHMSEQHPWFQAALASPTAPERAHFHFRDGLCVDGKIPTEALKPICRLGGPKYARLGEIVSMPPVGRTEQMVVFAADERVDSRN